MTAALKDAPRKLRADYHVPYLAHACMEPLNCTAQVRPDRVDLWMSTQSPDGILAPIAEVAGTKPENVYVHNCFLGGGFGRRSPADFASEAVKIAKTLDVPVKMIWSRDEDTRMGRYRPMSHMRFDAALDDSGKPTAYVSHSVTPSILATAGPARSERRGHDVGRRSRADSVRHREPAHHQHPQGDSLVLVVLARGRQDAERLRARVFRRRACGGGEGRSARLSRGAVEERSRELSTRARGVARKSPAGVASSRRERRRAWRFTRASAPSSGKWPR